MTAFRKKVQINCGRLVKPVLVIIVSGVASMRINSSESIQSGRGCRFHYFLTVEAEPVAGRFVCDGIAAVRSDEML